MIGRARILAVGLGAALGVGLLVAADRAAGPDAAPAAPAAAAAQPAKRAPESGPHATAAAKRPRVPAGVLVRAASRRAQEREAANPAAPERRRGKDGGEVLSVEIDWHAGASTER